MAANISLDEGLIDRAVRAGKHRSRREAVTTALEEYIRLKGRLRLLELEGMIDFDSDWDYKQARRGARRNGGPAPGV